MPAVLATLALVAACEAGADGQLGRYALDRASMQQWRLPARLNEISGLAFDAQDRLFAVADELAVVYELDVDDGRLVKAFAFGDPVLRGDFEGIAVAAGRVWLVTSDGELYAASEGGDGEQVSYRQYATGLGALCEIEGLAAEADAGLLWLACKEPRGGETGIALHAWSLDRESLQPALAVTLPVAALRARIGASRFNPSGLVVLPGSGHFLLVAARQRAIAEVDRDGRLVAAMRLPLAERHRQPEGIELATDGRLLVADEGGSHKARLAVYFPRPETND